MNTDKIPYEQIKVNPPMGRAIGAVQHEMTQLARLLPQPYAIHRVIKKFLGKVEVKLREDK